MFTKQCGRLKISKTCILAMLFDRQHQRWRLISFVFRVNEVVPQSLKQRQECPIALGWCWRVSSCFTSKSLFLMIRATRNNLHFRWATLKGKYNSLLSSSSFFLFVSNFACLQLTKIWCSFGWVMVTGRHPQTLCCCILRFSFPFELSSISFPLGFFLPNWFDQFGWLFTTFFHSHHRSLIFYSLGGDHLRIIFKQKCFRAVVNEIPILKFYQVHRKSSFFGQTMHNLFSPFSLIILHRIWNGYANFRKKIFFLTKVNFKNFFYINTIFEIHFDPTCGVRVVLFI